MPFKAVDIVGISALVDYAEMFRQAGVDIDLVVNPVPLGATEDEIIAAIGDADAVVTQTTFQAFPRSLLARLSNVKLIASIGVGYDSLDVDAATELGILAANVPDASIREVSDHTMALILACTRRIVRLNEVVKKGGWTTVGGPNISGEIWPSLSKLEGQTLGLIAFGRIAQAVVSKAKAFGLRVIAYDPYVNSDVFRALDVEQVTLDRLLPESDIVSVHAPLTPETDRLLGLKQLKKMKPTACLINTSRGAVVDHEALYTALSEGYISMAAVDVTEPEPIPADSPLLTLDNFICTAHSAGISPPAFAVLQRRPGEEIIRWAKGEWPVGLLDHRMEETYRQRWGRA
jgi:D-3-phosphoglycerate dehydrogenase